MLILLSLLMLLPGSARAEGEEDCIFNYTVDETTQEVTITGFADGKQVADVVIPAEIDGKPVVAIGAQAFQESPIPSGFHIQSLKIPASVRTIKEVAFFFCPKLKSVAIEENSQLETIGSSAFCSCESIESLDIPASVETIGSSAFNDTGLKSVTIAEGSKLTTIGTSAFQGCPLSSIKIPASVQKIENQAFCVAPGITLEEATFERIPVGENGLSGYAGNMFYNKVVTTVKVPAGTEDTYKALLGDDAGSIQGQDIVCDGLKFALDDAKDGLVCNGFSGDEMEEVIIPAEVQGAPVKSIAAQAFYQNETLKSISIPSSVTTMGRGVFFLCKSLLSVRFAANSQLTSIGTAAFANSGITSIEIPSSVTTIDEYAFNNCSGLTSVTFAANSQLTSIGEHAFEDSGITGIELPSSVTTIGEEAFHGSPLTSIEIPSSVTTMGSVPFYDCFCLTSVTFKRIPMGENNIDGYNEYCLAEMINLNTVNVPAGCEDDYKAKFSEGAEFVKGYDIVDAENGLKFKRSDAKDGLVCTGLVDNASQPARLELPSEASGCPVTQIAADAFLDNASLEYIIVKDKETYDKLMSHAFAASDKLVMQPKDALSLSDESGLAAASRPTLYQAGDISYERTLDDQDQYATLCLPFALDLGKTDGIFDKVYVPMNTLIHNTAKSTPELEHFVLMLEEQESDAIVPAAQPVFVKLSEGTTQIALTNQADELLNATLQPKTEAMKVVDWDGASGLMAQNKQFCISYGSLFQPKSDVSDNDHIWSFNANGSFGPQRQGAMPPFRLFLTVEENVPTVQAKAYSISIGVSDDSTTGIREIISSDDTIATNKPKASSAYAGIIYDLGGRKVATASEAKHLSKGIYILNGKKMVVK